MASFLLTIKASFSRELAGHLASRLGESVPAVSDALEGIVPVVLGGLVNRAGAAGGVAVFELSQQAFRATGSTFGTVTGLLGMLGSGNAADSAMTRGEILIGTLFGSPSGTLAVAIGTYAGIHHQSARTLLNLVGAALPALLGQYAQAHRLSAKELATNLSGLRRPVRAMLPQGLRGLTSLLWLDELGNQNHAATWPNAALCHTTEAVRRNAALLLSVGMRWYSGLVAMTAFSLLALHATC